MDTHGPIRPDFEGWSITDGHGAIKLPSFTMKGGVWTLALVVIWALSQIAKSGLSTEALGETSRVIVCLGACLLIVVVCGMTFHFIRSSSNNAKNKATRKHPPQPRGRAGGA